MLPFPERFVPKQTDIDEIFHPKLPSLSCTPMRPLSLAILFPYRSAACCLTVRRHDSGNSLIDRNCAAAPSLLQEGVFPCPSISYFRK
jgi:hypothetical protein